MVGTKDPCGHLGWRTCWTPDNNNKLAHKSVVERDLQFNACNTNKCNFNKCMRWNELKQHLFLASLTFIISIIFKSTCWTLKDIFTNCSMISVKQERPWRCYHIICWHLTYIMIYTQTHNYYKILTEDNDMQNLDPPLGRRLNHVCTFCLGVLIIKGFFFSCHCVISDSLILAMLILGS